MSDSLFSDTGARIVAVSLDRAHRFSKENAASIRIVAGFGVEADAHGGTIVQHRYSRRKDPHAANLRQVHLIPAELLDEVRAFGFLVEPGELGENVTTRGLDLAALPRGARLRLGAHAVIEITGLRTPCVLIDRFRAGLKDQLIGRDARGAPALKAGVMSVALVSGLVGPGDAIALAPPPLPHIALTPV